MHQLVHDQTNDIETAGTYDECLARFHRLCGFSYGRHKEFCFDTYTIRPIA